MKEQDLLFYNEYEQFYTMTSKSDVFRRFCAEAFGEDFSQDGFSDIKQINRILEYIPQKEDLHILDIGCGNGKMLGYLQKKTGAFIHGFDYSRKAVRTAKQLFPDRSDFRRELIDNADYPKDSFDMILSMDSMYFTNHMRKFVGQIWKWMRSGGVFFCAYQEGDVIPKTENADTSELAKALRENHISFTVSDITKDCYELLKRKRAAAVSFRKDFLQAGEKDWYDMLLMQTECACEPWENFQQKMARYLFVAEKD